MSQKEKNLGRILRLIASGKCSSRVELTSVLPLTKMSVSNMVTELMERGLLEQKMSVVPKDGAGRQAKVLDISEKAPLVVGLLVSRGVMSAVLCDMKLNIRKRRDMDISSLNKEELCNAVVELVESVTDKRVAGIGVCSLGPVDIVNGVILNPPNFNGIRDINIVDILKEHFTLPVIFDSQYNSASKAERIFGVGRKYKDFIFVGLSNGIGSGVVSNGEILRNSGRLTSELGHVSIDMHGQKCACGRNGCVERYAGANAVVQKVFELTGQKLSYKQICESRDENIQKILRESVEALACALVSAVNLFNPQAVIIGGEGVYLGEEYMSLLERLINAQKLSGENHKVKLEKPEFMENSQTVGACCNFLCEVFNGNIEL